MTTYDEMTTDEEDLGQMKTREKTRRTRGARGAAAILLALAAIVPASLAAPAVAVTDGDAVWIGARQGHPGSAMFAVYAETPADPAAPGEPDLWAYCIEHDVSPLTRIEGVAGDRTGFLGSNKFTDPVVQSRVHWTLTHGYPAVDLPDLAAAVGLTGLSRDDAIEATQYAIWNFTDLWSDPTTAWNWESPDSEAVYRYLVLGALAAADATPPAVAGVSVSVAGPPTATAGTLAGPFVVSTDAQSASVSSTAALAITDAAGNPIDTTAVGNGQELYLDLRGVADAGAATITATVDGSGASGLIVSVPTTPGATPTAGTHAQSLILAAAADATTSASTVLGWAAIAPASIGTTLVDAADDDRVLPWDGGTAVDTIAYTGLTPGTEYTVSGKLMRAADGSRTGIEGSTTFTPASADGAVEVTFTIPRGYAGESLVAFEQLTSNGVPIAEHTDIDDANQTVTLEAAPSIGTLATTDNAADDKVLPLTGGMITDTVSYQDFEPNVCTATGCETEYELRGELMLVDGSGATPTGIVSDPLRFTTEGSAGSIDVTFELSAADLALYAGKQLVAFETVAEWTLTGDSPVREDYAEHRDPTDADQTVTVMGQTTTAVPGRGSGLAATGGALPLGLASAAAVAAIAGAVLLMARRRTGGTTR